MQFFVLLAYVMAFSNLLNVDERNVGSADIKFAWSLLAWASLIGLAWWIGQVRQLEMLEKLQGRIRSSSGGDRLFGVAYMATTFLVFVVLDFAAILHSNCGLKRFFMADELAVGTALAAPLIIAWLFLVTPTADRLTSDWTWRLRRVGDLARYLIVVPLVPVLLIACVADVQRFVFPAATDREPVIVAFIGVLAVAVLLPCLIKWCWPTSCLSASPERATIESVLRLADVRVTEIVRWDTRGRIANAAISGFLPCLRYLFVTDEVLRRLDQSELRAVTAHEAAHCHHGHLARLALSLAIPFLALLISDQWWPKSILGGARLPLMAGVVLGAWGIWHGRWARLLEHQADVTACQLLAGTTAEISPPTVRLFERTLGALEANPGGDWLHPAPRQRIQLLDELASGATTLSRFERRVRRANHSQWLFILLLAVVYFGAL